jgi:integrase
MCHSPRARSTARATSDTSRRPANPRGLPGIRRRPISQAKERSLVEDATFHDSQHLAVTRLAKKLDILDLARAIGHRDLRQLQDYYNETTDNIAKRLD